MASISDTLDELRKSYLAEPDPEKSQQLQAEYDRAVSAALKLTGKIIGDNTAEYNTAVDELDKSVADLRKASGEIAKVAENIEKVAKAVDLIVKVASKVAK